MTLETPAPVAKREGFIRGTKFIFRFLIALGFAFLAAVTNRFAEVITILAGLGLVVSIVWVIAGAFKRQAPNQEGKSKRSVGNFFLAFLAGPIATILVFAIGNGISLGIHPYSPAELAQQAAKVEEQSQLDAKSSEAKKTCETILNNISKAQGRLDAMAAAKEATPLDSDNTFWYWPESYAVMNAGSNERTFVQGQFLKYFPETLAGINKHMAGLSAKKFFAKDSYEWLSAPSALAGDIFAELETSLLRGTTLDARQKISTKTFFGNNVYYSSTYAASFTNYLETLGVQCDMVALKAETEKLFAFENAFQSVDLEVTSIALEIYGCNVFGKGNSDMGLVKCAASQFVAKDLGGDSSLNSDRNPFTDPYSSESLNDMAKFSWCWNQGLILNSAGTACEVDEYEHIPG